MNGWFLSVCLDTTKVGPSTEFRLGGFEYSTVVISPPLCFSCCHSLSTLFVHFLSHVLDKKQSSDLTLDGILDDSPQRKGI